MKKLLLLALACTWYAHSFAQLDSLTVEWDTSTVSHTVVIDSIFENVNLSYMQTDYLLEKGAVM